MKFHVNSTSLFFTKGVTEELPLWAAIF